ncbi:uncharacterized protein [Asterias amurensis]|uniref:uncharacterized protein n=1 Tax=Asterias amurensis TaxID=7602 RepID=UPI003AB7C4CF
MTAPTALNTPATSSSSSTIRDLINVHLNVNDASALLTGTRTMTTKPLDLSIDGSLVLDTHSLLGASISSSHGVPNSSGDSVNNAIAQFNNSTHHINNSSTSQQSQYSSIFPVDDRDNPHPFNAVTVPLESNLRPNETHLARHSCKWNTCGQKFVEMEDLVNHVNERHVLLVEGEYCCKWEGCSRKGKGFNARYKMLIHVRTHTNEKPHQCPICHKSFSRLENLKIHNRSHTGERPYVCPVAGCNKRYSNSSDRFKHTRTHLEEKPYFCKVAGCDKRYTDPSSLRKHVKTFGHYANCDHLNHYISQKPSTTSPPPARPSPRISPSKPSPSPVPIIPGLTQSPPTSNVSGLPEGVIVYPILVHSPSLQPHYSYVTLPGHLSDFSGNTSATFSMASLHNNETTKDGERSQRFGLNQDGLSIHDVSMECKSESS